MLDSRPAYAAQYGGALADHLPMALSALERMGADTSRRDTFARRYIVAKALRVLEIGEAELQAREALYARMQSDGWPAVLRTELHGLAFGLGAGAFHAFIRVAYGIIEDDAREIAAGLAYWKMAALDVGSANRLAIGAEPFDVEVALARVRDRIGDVSERVRDTDMISDRMEAIARDPSFDLACGRPRIGPDFISQIASATVRAFAAGRNFTLLHAMTATHALRVIEPFAENSQALLHDFWRAYVAAYVSSGAAPLRDMTDFTSDIANAPQWDALLALACASDDEHVIKATFTAWTEDSVYHNPLYRVAAARYIL